MEHKNSSFLGLLIISTTILLAAGLSHRHSFTGFNSKGYLHIRSECRTTIVDSGDTCETLAKACHISGADFTKYNSNDKLCSSLQPGQHVCCSEGALPDLSPKIQLDGSCDTHNVTAGESCDAIASALSIKVTDIDAWNKHTWRFPGCKGLQAGQVICVSKGSPPMPLPLDNALCGPQVPNTTKPDNISEQGVLENLNPCPLNGM